MFVHLFINCVTLIPKMLNIDLIPNIQT